MKFIIGGRGRSCAICRVRAQVYTITRCLPIEGDGRVRYRIKSGNENFERVVTEDELSRLG